MVGETLRGRRMFDHFRHLPFPRVFYAMVIPPFYFFEYIEEKNVDLPNSMLLYLQSILPIFGTLPYSRYFVNKYTLITIISTIDILIFCVINCLGSFAITKLLGI